METNSVSKMVMILYIFLIMACNVIDCSVTYDKKAIVIDGQRRILLSGSIHYPRSTPEVLIFQTVILLSHAMIDVIEDSNSNAFD